MRQEEAGAGKGPLRHVAQLCLIVIVLPLCGVVPPHTYVLEIPHGSWTKKDSCNPGKPVQSLGF